MSLLDKFVVPQVLKDCVAEHGINPVGLHIEVSGCAAEGTVNGQPAVLAGTNNYLGLTFEPECLDAAITAVQEQGTGTTGSRMANGTYGGHLALERELADFFEAPSSIVFTTGYQANLGMISALAGPSDVILLDADSHASIYDGAKLSGAEMYRFRHNDVSSLEKRLRRLGDKAARTLVIVEGLYSMMGDLAPLKAMCEVTHRYGAMLLVDEAHSLGLLGEHGRGQVEAEGILDDVDFIVGTFSKSLGSVGGYCVSRRHDLDQVRNFVRAYLFTASAAPSTIASARASLKIIQDRPVLRKRLWDNAETIYEELRAIGYQVGPQVSPVVAVVLNDPKLATEAWHALLQRGVYVNLVMPPASPGNFCLLRCSLSAAHNASHLRRIVTAFRDVYEKLLAPVVGSGGDSADENAGKIALEASHGAAEVDLTVGQVAAG